MEDEIEEFLYKVVKKKRLENGIPGWYISPLQLPFLFFYSHCWGWDTKLPFLDCPIIRFGF